MRAAFLYAAPLAAWVWVLAAPAVAEAEDLTPEQLAELDDTGSLSFSYQEDGESVSVEIFEQRSDFGVEYIKSTSFTSKDGKTRTETRTVFNPDPFAAYYLKIENTDTAPVSLDMFGTAPILPIVGGPGAPPRVFSRVEVTLSDTGGAAGARLEPLLFPNMFETFVTETELGGLTDGGAALGPSAITQLGTTSLTVGPRDGPNPATDPGVEEWNYLVPAVNVTLSPGDTAEVFGIFAMVEAGQPFPDADEVFERLRNIPEPSLGLFAAALGFLSPRGRRRQLQPKTPSAG